MLFTEIVFAPFVLLTLVALAMSRGRNGVQLGVLLAASYIFYGWWDVRFLALIVFSSALDWAVGAELHGSDSRFRRRLLLTASLVGNLGLLGFFKYAGFFVESLRTGLASLGIEAPLPTLEILLPVGISFYTFQSLSYTFDIYFGRLEPEPSLLRFLVYVSAFPQLVAGPIVRARELLPQLRGDFFARSNSAGLLYIFYGLAKKLYLADILGANVADRLFRNPGGFGALDTLFALYAYSFQIFLDFSAYSDIALGLGLLLGLRLPVNFRSPYGATNPVEFWRRWHITLSSWFRDYLYIPLGGNRGGDARLAGNLFFVMLVAGLWHGASLTFVLWGAVHGAWLVGYRFWRRWQGPPRPIGSLRRTVYAVLFFHFVTLAWVLFRAPNLEVAGHVLARLAVWSPATMLIEPWPFAALVAAVLVHGLGEPRIEGWSRRFARLPVPLQGLAVYALLALLALATQQAITNRLFIYFQF
jgi:D-alanyl-lipoteichoic acid acyltransferase DltB (MBOAT superfamily)